MHPRHSEIRALLEVGESDLGIARQLHVWRGTVARVRQALGIPGYRTNAASTHCRRGHPFDQYEGFTREGWRYCRACANHRYRRVSPAEFAARHAGHDTAENRSGKRYCITCMRGDHDVDEIAVERAVSGDPPARLSPAEREQAVMWLSRYGLPAELIAARVGCAERTVWRIYSRTGAPVTPRVEVAA